MSTQRSGVTAASLDALAEPTPAEWIGTKPGRGGSGPLSYVTARFVQERLDTLGRDAWQVRFEDRPDGSVRCGIGILVEGEWVWKWDVGTESDIESEKGAHSDAFKRAGVMWGIARDLYPMPHANGNGHGGGQPPAPARPSGAGSSSPARGGTAAGGRPRPSAPTVPQQQGRPQPPTCPVHNWAMRDNRTHDGWFCSGKQPSGDWCDQRFTDAEASDLASQASALDDLPF